MRIEQLEARHLLAISPLPAFVPAVESLGSLVYRTSAADRLDSAGQTDSFSLALDANQLLSITARPLSAEGLTPRVELSDPAAQLVASADAGSPDAAALVQTQPTSAAGTYRIDVTSLAGGGDYELVVRAGAAVEAESVGGASNDGIASAQSLAATSVLLPAGADRLAVSGRLDGSADVYAFDLTAGQHAQLALARDDAAPLFSAPEGLIVAGKPAGVALGDMNGDGRPDIVTANQGIFPIVGEVSVLLQNADGTYAAPQSTAVGDRLFAFSLGHFNADAHLDVVVASYDLDNVTVMFGAGDGTFSSTLDLTVGDGPVDVAVDDIDADGAQDIVVTNALSVPGTVSILYGVGDGTFDAEVTLEVGDKPRGVRLADLNHDNHLDLVVTGEDAATDDDAVAVLLGDGSRGFAAPISFATGIGPRRVALADVNDDGHVDVVTANSGQSSSFPNITGNTISVLLGDGAGNLGSRHDVKTQFGPTTLALGDVDQDGILDIVTNVYGQGADGEAVLVLLGRGDGSFVSDVQRMYQTGMRVIAAVVGDVDQDGDLDIVTADDRNGYPDYGVSILRGRSSVQLELLDAAGVVVGTGSGAATNAERTIDAFTATTGGTYFARISGDAAVDYTLAVVRGAGFDLEPNNDEPSGPLPTSGVVLGTLRGNAPPQATDGVEIESNNNVASATEARGSFAVQGPNSLWARLTGSIASFNDRDFFRIHAGPGDEFNIRRGGGGQGGHSVSLVDNQGGTIVGATGGSFSTGATINYTMPDNAYTGDYYISATYLSTIRTGPYSITVEQRTNNRYQVADRDVYEVELVDGQQLTLSTLTPGGDSDQPTNDADPVLDLFDSTGALVASDDNGASDGRNARIAYEVPVGGGGTYRIRVTPADSASVGDYVLVIGDGTHAMLDVLSVTPAGGRHVSAYPATVRVEVSQAIDPATVDAADLTIDGVPADAVRIIDHSTLEFDFTNTTQPDGEYTISLAGGVFASTGGAAVSPFDSTFTVDSIHPTVVASSVQSGEVLAAGDVTLTFQVSEPLARIGLGPEDVSLVEAFVNGDSFTPSTFRFDEATNTVEVSYVALPEGEYALTLHSGPNALRDRAGLGLDGTGSGTQAADYTVDFVLDAGTLAFAAPLTPVAPLGSWIREGSLPGQIHTIGDVDRFVVELDATERLTASVSPTDAAMRVGLRILGPGDVLLGESLPTELDKPAFVQSAANVGAGSYTIEVVGLDGTGRYQLRSVVNAGAEAEDQAGQNDDIATAETISGSAISVAAGSSRMAVVGQTGDAADVYRFSATAGDRVSLAVAQAAGDNRYFSAGQSLDVDLSGATVSSVATADLDGDGRAEILVGDTDGKLTVFNSSATGQLSVRQSIDISTGDEVFAVVAGDIDGDGDVDVVAATQGGGWNAHVLLGDGGTLGAPTGIGPIGGRKLALADLDGQNGLDLVSAEVDQESFYTRLRQADGTFAAEQTTSTVGKIVDLTVGDIDGDGDLDVAAATYTGYGGYYAYDVEGQVEVLLGAGDGTFTPGTTLEAIDIVSAVTAGDLDGDGDAELVVAGCTFDGFSNLCDGFTPFSVAVFSMRDDGTFLRTGGETPALPARSLALGDVDGDGDLDVFSVGNDDAPFSSPEFFVATVLVNRGDGSIEATRNVYLSDHAPVAALADIDGDGVLDFVGGPSYFEQEWPLTVALGRGSLDVELLDAVGSVVATGVQIAGQIVIDDFVPAQSGDYFARVSAHGAADYALVVSLGSIVEREPNDAGSPQSLAQAGAVTGHLAELETVGNGADGVVRVAIVGRGNDAFGLADVLGRSTNFAFDVDVVVDLATIDADDYLQAIDVVVLPSTNVEGDFAQFGAALRTWVDEGGALITTGQTTAALSSFSVGIDDYDAIIPVDAAALDLNEFTIVVQPQESGHPILAGVDAFDLGVNIRYPDTSALDAGAIVLATGVPRQTDLGPLPIIVEGSFGLGRTLWNGLNANLLEFNERIAPLWERAVAYAAGGGTDEFTFEVAGGETLILSTTTPGFGTRTDNTLDPSLTLYNSLGFLVAGDDNNATDGRNALIVHQVPAGETGTYRVVVGRSSGEGDYGLSIGGMTIAPSAAAAVTATYPANAAKLSGPPAFLDIAFSDAIRLDSLDVGDIVIDGGASVLGVSAVDGRTVRFAIDVPNAAGVYNYTLADGAFVDVQGQASVFYSGAFEIDRTGPRVVGQTPAVQAAVPFNTLTLTFDEPIAPGPYDDNVFESFERPDTGNILFSIRDVTAVGNQLIVEFNNQSQLGTYTFVLDAAKLTDVAGNALDQDGNGTGGEPTDNFTGTVSIQSMDLTVEAFAPAASQAEFGGPLSVSWTVRNIGGDPAVEGWVDRVWLSADSTFSPQQDIQLGDFPADDIIPLASDGAYSRTVDVTLPLSVALSPGTFHLFVETDATQTQAELVESNNTATASIDLVLPPLPDLVISNVQLPATAFSNQSIDITWTVTNNGGAAATGTWTDQVFLSTDAAAGDDQFYGSFPFTGTLAPGQSIVRTQSVFLPFNVTGQHFAVVVGDATNTVFEHAQDDNNTTVSANFITVAQSLFPDLRTENVTTTVTDVELSTQQFTVNWVVRNSGSAATSASFWTDYVYLSADTVLDGSDRLIGLIGNQSYLAVGDAYGSSKVVQASGVPAGDYYILVKADATTPDRVEEFIAEDNNVGVGPRISVHLPPPPDMIVTNVAAPPLGLSGQPISVTYSVENVGPGIAGAGSWVDRVYLSTDLTFDTADTLLGSFGRSRSTSLGGPPDNDVEYTSTVNVTLPIGISGEHFILVQTDATNRINEFAFEQNNFLFDESPLQIALTPPPDLVVESINVPANAQAGRSITIDYTAFNRGATDVPNGPWRDALYLSLDETLDGGDIFLRDLYIYGAGLAVDGSYARETSFSLPNGLSGDYFLLVHSDRLNQVFELDNANNIVASSSPISIGTFPPDLVVSTLTNDAAVFAGEAVNVSWTVTNQGTGDTIGSSWYDRVYLSTDDVPGGDRVIDAVTHVGKLDPGGDYTVSRTLTIPFDVSGDVFLYVFTDDSFVAFEGLVSEFAGESNNNTNFSPLAVTRRTPDLEMTPTSVASENGRLRVEWSVANVGDNVTNTSYWYDAVVASTNDVYGDADDVLLRQEYRSSRLIPSQSYSVNRLIDVPYGVTGQQHIFLAADYQNRNVDEGAAEANNVALAGVVDIDALRTNYDFVIAAIDAPDEATSGQFATFSWTVRNVGDPLNVEGTRPIEAGRGVWTDNVYLSRDQVFDPATDTFLGQASTGVASLVEVVDGSDTYEEYQRGAVLRIPAGLTGPFYVFVLVDRGGHIVELGAEGNNSGYDIDPVFVSLAPPVDLVAGEVTVPPTASLGATISMTITLHNDGDTAASGYWIDRLYLSTDTQYSPDDVRLTARAHNPRRFPTPDVPVPAHGSETFDYSARLPAILPGEYFLVLRTDIFNHVPESNEENNLSISLDRVSVDVPEIVIDAGAGSQAVDVTLGNQQIRVLYYRFDAVDGQTMSLDANYIDIPDEFVFDPDLGQSVLRPVARQSAVSAYLAFGRVPTPFDYDLRQDDLLATLNHFHTEESLIVPRTRAGTYYLRVEVRDTHPHNFYNPFQTILGSHEIFDLDVTVLPFQISSLEGNAIGNAGPATTTVVASNFTACTAVELLSGGVAVRSAEHVTRLGDDTALVTFDYGSLPAGDYEIRVTDHTGASDVETISVVEGAGSRVGGSITGPSPLRRSSQYAFYATYGNSGDADGIAPLLLLESVDSDLWGLTREGQAAQPTLQALGISLEGPAGMLRPGELGSVPVYFTTATGQGSSSRFLVHTITADDSRPLVFAEIEESIRPETMTDDEWNVLRPKIVERLGPTWGSYVRALSETATNLSRHDVRTQDVSIIFRQLISEVRNPYPVLLSGSVVAESTCGPLADPVVQAVDAAGEIVSVAAGLDNGDFTFFGLPAGVYALIAEAEGAARTLFHDVVVGSDGASQTLSLPAESRITGEIVPGVGIVADALITVSARPLSPNAVVLGNFLVQSTDTTFELGGLSAGDYELTFDVFGGETKTQTVTLGAGESLDVGQIDLAALGWVAGTVVSTVGPLDYQNVRVVLLDGTRLVDTSLVDADGNYVFFSITPGPFTVRAVDISTSPLVGSAAAVEVLPGVLTDAADLTLAEGAVIGGAVTLASTAAPLENVPVRLRSADGGVATTTTDASGDYQFAGLASGDYTITVPGADAVAQTAVSVTTMDGTFYLADLSFEPVATLDGRLTRTDGSPVAGAAVRLKQNDEYVLNAPTDADGNYRFLLLSGGTFDVDPIADGASFAEAESVNVSAGEAIVRDFVAGSAELLVQAQDAGAEPGTVTVLLRQASLDDQGIVGSTSVDLASDPSGTVQFMNLVPGEYVVEMIVAGQNRSGSVMTTVVDGAANEVVVVNSLRRTIFGSIFDANGEPIQNATVFAVPSGGVSVTKLGFARPDGEFQVRHLEPGAYTLVVQAPGYETQLLPINVAFDRTIDVTLADATTSVAGRVVDDSGAPIASATVRVVNADGIILAQGVSAADGTFQVDGVVGNDLTVVVEATGYTIASVENVDVAAGANVDVADVAVDPLGVALFVESALAAPSATAGGDPSAPQPAGSPPINGALVFAVPAVSGIYALLEVFVFDAERSSLEVDPSDVPPEPNNCAPCHGHYIATSQAVLAQNQAFAVVEARDNDLDWQAASLPAAIILETAVNAGAIATAVLAVNALLAGAGVTVGALGAAGTLGTAGAVAEIGFTIVQTAGALDAIINIMYSIQDAIDAASLPSLSDALSSFGNLTSAMLQIITVFADLLAAAFNGTTYITQPLQQFSNFWGGAGNLIGLVAQLGMLIDTFTYTATRDAIDLITQAREFRDMAFNSYFAVVLAAGNNLSNYLACIDFYQFHTEYCPADDGGSTPTPDPNDPSLPFPELPPPPPPPAPPPGQYFPAFVTSADPNDILGPAGFGDEKWVTLRDPLAYTIRFENMADATAPAMLVTIEQQLDDDLDFRTFRVDDFGFGETQVELNASQPFFQGRIPLADDSPYVVDVIAIVDIITGIITWVFQTLDPSTGEPPIDALAGFLPPNDENGRGEGFVSYTIRPKQSAATGSRVDAQATIVFDDNEPIDTPPIFNTLDAAAPASSVDAVNNPAGEETFAVRWTAGDDAGGSALSTVDVFVSRDGRPFEPWLVATTLAEAPYIGAMGHTYAFYSVARDNAGNAESLPTSPDSTTSVPFPGLFGDINGDGAVGIADLIRVRNNLGLSGAATHDDGDLTGDRRVNMEDVAAFLALFGQRDSGGPSPAAAEAVVVAAPNARGETSQRRLAVERDVDALAAPRRATRRAANVETVDAALMNFDQRDPAESRLTARRQAVQRTLSARPRSVAREVDAIFDADELR